MDGMLRDIRFGVRNLARNPGLTAVVILSLALGIGANTAIFSLIRVVMLQTLPVRDPGSLVLVHWCGDSWPTGMSQSGRGGTLGFRLRSDQPLHGLSVLSRARCRYGELRRRAGVRAAWQ